jgi:hypothetical protein
VLKIVFLACKAAAAARADPFLTKKILCNQKEKSLVQKILPARFPLLFT